MKAGLRSRRRKIIAGELMALLVLLACLGLSAYRYFQIRPGWVERSSIRASERTDSRITLKWAAARNAAVYEIYFRIRGDADHEYEVLHAEECGVSLENLKEGTEYSIYIKAYTADGIEGISSEKRYISTKSRQKLTARGSYVKLTSSKAFDVSGGACTELETSTSNSKVATVDREGKVSIKGAGRATITVRAKESDDYMPAAKKIKLTVIRSLERKAAGAAFEVVHTIGSGDVRKVMTVSGSGGAVTPQSVGFDGSRYYIAFGMSGTQRVVSYKKDGTGKKVYVPSHNLGHPNGFTYCDKTKLCYSLRGNTTRVDTFNPKDGSFGVTRMPYGAAGICYDRKEDVLYTTSRTGIRAYSSDGRFTHKKLIPDISRPMFVYTQDSGAHAGYVFRCMSGRNKHAENYIDMFRAGDSKYLGSIKVTGLGELESIVFDNNGYMQLLVNSGIDYIYQTEIKAEDLD